MSNNEEKLALFGGTPIVQDHSKLKTDWPIVHEVDRKAVLKAFDNREFSGRGSPEVLQLEEEFSRYFKMPFATALNSGTAALHAALYSLGISNGDEVIVPNLTFIAPAMAVVHNGSIPVFADIDPKSYNVSAATIEPRISPITKAVIVVHMHGIPVDMAPVVDLCEKHNLALIEDVAQAPGARYNGRLLGTFGDASTFSLMAQKNLATCGECGILLNRDTHAKNRAEMLRIYGEILKEGEDRKYNSYSLGWNYTLNPIQAAMARTQLERFSHLTNRIRERGEYFIEKIRAFPWIVPPLHSREFEGVFHFFRIRISGECVGLPDTGHFRQAVQDALNAENLNVRFYQNSPLSLQPFFQSSVRKATELENKFPNTLDVIRNTLVLGAMGSSPAYLLCSKTIEKYIMGMEKISANIQQLVGYANNLKYSDPWVPGPVISDSFGVSYAEMKPYAPDLRP